MTTSASYRPSRVAVCDGLHPFSFDDGGYVDKPECMVRAFCLLCVKQVAAFWGSYYFGLTIYYAGIE